MIISGLFVQGLGVGMLLILGNIQLLHIAKREYMDTSKAVINAQCLLVFVQGFGETFGMLMGPFIVSEYSFRSQCDFFAFFSLIIGGIYLSLYKRRIYIQYR